MMRSVSVVPSRRPPSRTSIVIGERNEIHPDAGGGAAVAIGASTDAVTPAWITTF